MFGFLLILYLLALFGLLLVKPFTGLTLFLTFFNFVTVKVSVFIPYVWSLLFDEVSCFRLWTLDFLFLCFTAVLGVFPMWVFLCVLFDAFSMAPFGVFVVFVVFVCPL